MVDLTPGIEDPYADDRRNWPEHAQLMEALGRVVENAAMVDMTLRSVYCSLLATPYAVLTAGGMMTGGLIDNCQMLLTSHRHLKSEGARQPGLDLLKRTRAASLRRNRLVHDTWAIGKNNAPTQLEQVKKSHEMRSRERTYQEVAACAVELSQCAALLSLWRWEAFPVELIGLDAQLRWEDELGRQAGTNDE